MKTSLSPSRKYLLAIALSGIATVALYSALLAVPPPPDPLTESPRTGAPVDVSIAVSALQVSPADPVRAEASNGGYVAGSIGPDLIVGHVFRCAVLGRVGPIGSGTIGMSCWTTACTIGDEGTNWWGLPNVDHPMISVNLFRLRKLDGTDRLEQLGQSWLKHGFGTENADDCGFGCTPGGHFNLNNPGCSDTYAASQFVPCDMGPRSMMNPYTGVMPFGDALGPAAGCGNPMYPSRDHRDHVHNGISHRLQIRDVDLIPALNSGAKYFSEGQYLLPHEFVAGNGTQNNNVSYRRVNVSGGDACSSGFIFEDTSDTFTEQPAINAWTGASQTLIEPAPLVDGRGFLVYKITDLGNVWHYEYALYNMNMDRAMGSLSIPLPAGVVVSDIGFHAPLNHAPEPHTESYTNTPWVVSTTGGAVTWSTDTFAVDPLANAVRFGTMYNFWFDASSPPQSTNATVGLFKTGASIAAATLGPSGVIDCNNNTIADRCDLDCGAPDCAVPGCGTKTDCNTNGVPDDCEPDCNHNGIADRCDIAIAFSADCDADTVPDECEGFGDCDGNSIRDDCEVYANPNLDSNGNGIHDACELLTGFTIYVDDNAPNDPFPNSTLGSDPFEDGSAAHPYDAIQEGINAASGGDTVLVLNGLYKGFGNNNFFFNGKIVTVRGKNGPDHCVIDLENNNSLAVLDRGEGLATRIDGFHVIHMRIGLPLFPVIQCFGSSPTIANCKFTGPGIAVGCYNNSQAVVTNCTMIGLSSAIQCQTSRPVVSNCLIYGGSTGVFVLAGNGMTNCLGASSPKIINCTISGATTGVQAIQGAIPSIENTIVWGNSSSQISIGGFEDIATAIVSYSDVQGGWLGTGNIDVNPLFVNPGTGNYRPAGRSPCIDAGNNAVSLPSTDLDGGPRLFDDPATTDPGAGTPPIVDIGAYEWSDCNSNQMDDAQEVDQQPGIDCNDNHLPDECEPFVDCNANTVRDMCDISSGFSLDCNDNSIPDSCDISTGTSQDCDGNGVLNECDPDCQPNGVPDGCDISGSTSEDVNGNGTPDECELMTPQPDPSGVNKNRTLSVLVPAPTTAGPGSPTALRVRMIELQNPIPPNLACCPPPDFSTFESGPGCTDPMGCIRWVGKPNAFLESQENPAQGNLRAARLQCTPYYHDWAAEGIFQIVGGEVLPSSTYVIENLTASCAGNENICTKVSSPLQVKTARSGDVEQPFNPPSTQEQPNAIDIAQVVNKLKNVAGAPSKAITQLQPDLPELNADINALDIVAVVDAVKQFAYSFSGPCRCPSAVTCESTACTTPNVCVTAFGTGATCVKTCTGGANAGDPCINDTHGHCPGSTCGAGFCRDRCGRCTP